MASGGVAPHNEDLCRNLAALLDRRTVTDGGRETAIPELKFWRVSNPTEPAQVVQQPAVYVVVQGRKQITVGEETYTYDPSQYLAVSLELPAVGRVVEASPQAPYLCLTLSVDARELAALSNGRRGRRVRAPSATPGQQLACS